MLENKTKRTVASGLFLALGILLPFVTSHAFGIPGTVLLPMHIPVLLCGFFCGSLYGAICGLVLPFLNSIITGMPAMYPNAIFMTGELFTYGLLSGVLYKLFHYSRKLVPIYICLAVSMTAGRVVSGALASLLLFINPQIAKYSVVGALVAGIPGIIVQLILIPIVLRALKRNAVKGYDAKEEAIGMITEGKATCVVVKNNIIISADSPRGISYLLNLCEKNKLDGVFVADTIIGKAAAMLLTLGKADGCYGEVMSVSGLEWLTAHNIEASYGQLTEVIENRTKTGSCPMELTVKDLTDEKEACAKLRKKVEELRSKNN